MLLGAGVGHEDQRFDAFAWRQMLAALPVGACLIEADSFRVADANAPFLEFLGAEVALEPGSDRPLAEVLPEAARLPVLEAMSSALAREAVVPVHGLVCGGGRWSLRISPIRESSGRVGLLLLVASRAAAASGSARPAEAPAEGDAERRAEEVQGVLEAMTDGVILFGEDRRVRGLNEAASRLIGLDVRGLTLDELRNVLHIRSGDERALGPEELPEAQALRGQSVNGQRVRVRTFSGPRTVTVSAAPLLSGGATRGAVAVWRDVTERERVDAALRASQAQLRGLAESGVIGTVSFTLSGLITEANDTFLKMTGFSREELQAGELRWDELTPPEWMPRTLQSFETIRAAGRHTYEKEFFRKDGSRFWALIGGALAPGASEGMKFVVDISDRKRIEQALRQSEAQFRQIAEAMPQIVWMTRPDGFHEYFNHQFFEFSGATLESSRGDGWAKLLHPGDARPTLERWGHCLRTGEPYETEYRLKRARDGAYRWFLARALAVRDEEGRIIRWFGTCTEIHELKEAQARLREAMVRLEEADRHKNDFLALLSHELRNPLAPIGNSVFILKRAAPGGEQSRRAQTVIERQIAHLTRLVDDLLDVTRISRAKIRLQPERVELNGLVRRAAEDLGSLFERSGVSLELQLPAQPLYAQADATRILQVVGNLLTNAVKFTPPGGRVAISLARSENGRSVLRVKDTGAGMSPETLDRIFVPFAQAAQTLDRSRGGLGLGLALVKGLVELHGGSVRASSDGLGKGSEFVIELPLEQSPAPRAQLAVEPSWPKAPRRVLVVEDNPDAAESLMEVLRLDGHEVEVAGTGPEGLEKARRHCPDVVFCDIGLPGMDGYDVARTVRADPALRSTYLVALSGYALPEDVEKSKEAGFDRHIAKPPDLELLEKALALGPSQDS